MNGIEVCRENRCGHPEVACLILTSVADDEALLASTMAGAGGYVLKQLRGSELVDAICQVAAGTNLLDRARTARGVERLRAWGAPGMIRTCDARFRKPTLYPLSYGGWPALDLP
jgi:two-component system, NarL family, response regulator DevR